MSSNRTRLTGLMLATGLALLASACATPQTSAPRASGHPHRTDPLQTTAEPHGILLAPHEQGLSQAQAAELTKLADQWRERGRGLVLIEAPTRGGPAASATAQAARDALETFGVPRDAIDLIGYEDGVVRAPIRVSFLRVDAQVDACGRDWTDLTKTGNNQPTSNFGCAVNSNLAAMIGAPGDIDRPADTQPQDAGRRQVVIDKYRAGQTTSSQTDSQANGIVSRAVN